MRKTSNSVRRCSLILGLTLLAGLFPAVSTAGLAVAQAAAHAQPKAPTSSTFFDLHVIKAFGHPWIGDSNPHGLGSLGLNQGYAAYCNINVVKNANYTYGGVYPFTIYWVACTYGSPGATDVVISPDFLYGGTNTGSTVCANTGIYACSAGKGTYFATNSVGWSPGAAAPLPAQPTESTGNSLFELYPGGEGSIAKQGFSYTFDVGATAGYPPLPPHFFTDPNAISDGYSLGACASTEGISQKAVNCEAEPVNTATGAYETSHTDLVIDGALPFALSRNYSSIDPSTGIFGQGWSSILEMRLVGINEKLAEVQALGSADAAKTAPVAGQPVMLHSSNGAQLRFDPLGGGYQGQAGVISSLAVLSGGNFELTTKHQVTYRFDKTGFLTGVADRNGNGYAIDYFSGKAKKGKPNNPASGLPKMITTTSGRTMTMSYNGRRLSSARTQDGREVSYGYADDHLTSVTAPDQATMTYAYDGDLLTQIRDGLDRAVVTNQYNAVGQVILQTDATGEMGEFTYEPGITTFTDARGNSWVDTYAGNILVSSTDPEGAAVTYTREPATLDLIGIEDARGKLSSFAYDDARNLTSFTGPSGTNISITASFNGRNDPVWIEDAEHNRTTFDYDPRGNVTVIDPPLVAPTRLTPDPATGLPVAVTNANGHETLLAYNDHDQLTQVTPELGAPTTFGYDQAGRRNAVTEPRGNVAGADPEAFTSRTTFDEVGRAIRSTNPLGNETNLIYDEAGTLCRVLDANASAELGAPAPHTCTDAGAIAGETTYISDDRSDIVRIISPDEGTTDFDYDEVGNMETMTDASGHTTSYVYDALNRPVHVSTPQTFRDITYLPGGLLETMTLADGAVTTYDYDNASRLTGIDYSDPDTTDVSFEFDANSNRTRMSDVAGHQDYEYDALNRLTEISRPGTDTITYAYDDASNIIQRTYGTRAVDYSFDANERLKTVTSAGETTEYDYDVAGRLLETAYPNGWSDEYAYDEAGRLDLVRTLSGPDILNSFAYTRDGVGNPLQIASTGLMAHQVKDPDTQEWSGQATPDRTTFYSYDDAYRLTGACQDAPCTASPTDFIRYSYDQMGNRVTEQTPTEAFTYTYNAADQLVATTKPAPSNLAEMPASGVRELTYDVNGNLTQDANANFLYDQAGARVLRWGTGIRERVFYEHDGDGKRIAAFIRCCGGGPGGHPGGTVPQLDRSFLWDPQFSLPMMVSSVTEQSNRPDARIDQTYGNGLVSTSQDAQTLYQHPDGIGSISGLTDQDGTAVSRTNYAPFGEVTGTQVLDSTATGSSAFGFTGEYEDAISGLVHLRARQYDPSIGRFVSPDPLGGEVATSTYGYGANNPLSFVDPSGTAWKQTSPEDCHAIDCGCVLWFPCPGVGGVDPSPSPSQVPPSPVPPSPLYSPPYDPRIDICHSVAKEQEGTVGYEQAYADCIDLYSGAPNPIQNIG